MRRPPVVVVGAGLAGLVTATELSSAGVDVALVSAGRLGVDCASDWAQGGLAAAVGDDDDVASHVADTVAAGAGLCDVAAVERIVAAGPSVVEFLSHHGARLDRDAIGRLELGLEGGHSRRRIVHAAGDGSGREMTRAMVEAVRSAHRVTVRERAIVTRVVVGADGVVCGVVLRGHAGAAVSMPASAVVLATGGIGALFAHTTNPRGSWGSGLALGLRAGAMARDLEMVQFHPTALDVGLDPLPLVSEAVRGEGAHLVDDLGERVVDNDLAPRDVVARAIWGRLTTGRQVYLDARPLGRHLATRFPGVARLCSSAGLDPSVDLLPVRPAAHYHMGGLRTDDHGATSVPGLYAVGEVAATGLHGANRLASNSLLEAVVTGRAAAQHIAGAQQAQPTTAIATTGAATAAPTAAAQDDGQKPRDLDQNVGAPVHYPSWGPGSPSAPVAADRAALEAGCGVIRHAAGLERAMAALRPGAEPRDARLVAWLVAYSALSRRESRGGHTRTDFPRTDATARHTDLTLTEALASVEPLLTTRSA